MKIKFDNPLLFFVLGITVGYCIGMLSSWLIFFVLLYLVFKFHKMQFNLNLELPFLKLNKAQTNTSTIKAMIDAEVLHEIEAYCAWANIENINVFLEQSASLIFKKDKEWRNHQRSLRRQKNN